MPRITSELIAEQLHFLKQKLKKLSQQQRYDEASKVIEKILSLNPFDAKMMEKYIQVVNKTKNKYKIYQIYECLIKNDRNNLNLYTKYIDTLIDYEQYTKVKVIIKNALKIDDSQSTLYIKFAKVSHRSKTFHDGLEILQQYEKKFKQESKTNEKILLWRVYLSYQIAKYEDAYYFSEVILKLSDLSAQDYDYYMIQKCKYCALLGKYEESIKIGNVLLQKLAVHEKNKLKVHALKAYCHYMMNKKNQILPIMLSAININPKDQMINYKWCLFKILIYEIPRNEKQEEDNKKSILEVKTRMMKFLKKIQQCDQQNFQNTKLSDHFNWYSELNDYSSHVKFLYDALQNIDQVLEEVQKLAKNLFLSLLQGYEDCLRTNTLLIGISSQVSAKMKLSNQQNNKK